MAGKLYDIPVMGTHAHSWVMAFESELEAFRTYVKVFPQNPVLLLDTYDTLESGVPNAIKVFNEMRTARMDFRAGVRLDSGDIAKLSKEVHRRLEEAGHHNPLIVASNELDEYLIADMKRQGARVNSWGVGTKLVTGGDEPALGGVYKLAAVSKDDGWDIKMKISNNPEKTTDPGVKMPYRFYSATGEMLGDVMFLENEDTASRRAVIAHDRMVFERTRLFRESWERRPLLQQVMRKGKRLIERKPAQELQAYAKSQLGSLPSEMQRLVNPEIYWVGLSESLARKKRAAVRAFWAGKEAAPTEPGAPVAGDKGIGGEG
jgi:nicotinate phosphoribosyltransferase